MNAITKNTLISIGLGLAAYLLNQIISSEGFSLPSSGPQIASLMIYIVAIFIACSLVGTGASQQDTKSSSATDSTSSRSSSPRETGVVKWFNVKKGYGFITRDQGDDIFVHYRNILGSGRKVINEGQRVEFVVIDGDKGLQADEVEGL